MEVIIALMDLLTQKGSWLMDSCGMKSKLRALFDPEDVEFKSTSAEYKILALKEIFYCGFAPRFLNLVYKEECTGRTGLDVYQDSLHAMLEIVFAVANSDLSSLDNNAPHLWCQSAADAIPVEKHKVVENLLKDGFEIRKDEDAATVMRRMFWEYCMQNKNHKIIKNTEKVFDRIDALLIQHADIFEKNETKTRWLQIEDYVEDMHRELDPDYRKRTDEEAEKLIQFIEDLDIDNLKILPFFSARVGEHIGMRKDPRKWLYRKLCSNRQVYRVMKRMKPDIPF